MLLFALERALWTMPVLLVCVTLLFVLVHAIGGSPLRHGPSLGLSHEAWVKYGDPKPGAVLALLPLAQVARVLRFEMIEVGARDFVLAARGKGLRRPRLLAAHVLRPASVPCCRWPGRCSGSSCSASSSSGGSSRAPGSGATSSPLRRHATTR